jgi:glycosyltransferase involved in cell wall biosynthesis
VVLTVGTDLERYVLDRCPTVNHLRIENTAVHRPTTPGLEAVAELKSRLGLSHRIPIIYTGTFERYQGLGLLFESAQAVVRQHPEVIFIMVGGKPAQVEYWKKEISRLGLADQVLFVGTVSLEESIRYLELAEVLVSPRTEGLSVPLKIYSYLRSGKPILATEIYAQILTDTTAVLVEPTAAAYTAGLLQLIESPDLRSQLGRAAQAFAEAEFSIERYLAKLDFAYHLIR